MNKTLTIKLPSRRNIAKAIASLTGGVILVAAVACSSQTQEEKDRDKAQESAGVAPGKDTLEQTNLKTKRRIEENPNAIGYVYIYAFDKPIGYWVSKGKVSSNGSQAGPEQDIVWTCKTHHGCQPVVVDSKQDDGSYGEGDPGVFFFTPEGQMIVVTLPTVYSTQPLPIDVPKLNPTKS